MGKIRSWVLGITLMGGIAAQASIGVDILGYENGNTVYTITGTNGYFEVYLQCLETNASVSAVDSSVCVTDLGITPQQNHLFRIEGHSGPDGSSFSTTPSWQTYVVELYDTSMTKIGVYSQHLDRYFNADAGGPYSIAPGQFVLLDSSQSYFADYGWNPAASLLSPDDNDMVVEWKIDDISVGPNVSFDYLVNTLGLDYGIHTLRADIDVYGETYQFNETAYSTIAIVPEPATLLLLGVGGLWLRTRKQ